MKDTLIIGIGSILRGDDGIGVKVIDELEKEGLSPGVSLEKGDLSGLDLLKIFPEFRKVIIVDAAAMNMPPGSVRVFSPEDIEKADFNDKFSTHGMGLLETLTLADKLDISSSIVIVGIEPEETDYNLELSDTLKSKVPEIISVIKDLL